MLSNKNENENENEKEQHEDYSFIFFPHFLFGPGPGTATFSPEFMLGYTLFLIAIVCAIIGAIGAHIIIWKPLKHIYDLFVLYLFQSFKPCENGGKYHNIQICKKTEEESSDDFFKFPKNSFCFDKKKCCTFKKASCLSRQGYKLTRKAPYGNTHTTSKIVSLYKRNKKDLINNYVEIFDDDESHSVKIYPNKMDVDMNNLDYLVDLDSGNRYMYGGGSNMVYNIKDIQLINFLTNMESKNKTNFGKSLICYYLMLKFKLPQPKQLLTPSQLSENQGQEEKSFFDKSKIISMFFNLFRSDKKQILKSNLDSLKTYMDNNEIEPIYYEKLSEITTNDADFFNFVIVNIGIPYMRTDICKKYVSKIINLEKYEKNVNEFLNNYEKEYSTLRLNVSNEEKNKDENNEETNTNNDHISPQPLPSEETNTDDPLEINDAVDTDNTDEQLRSPSKLRFTKKNNENPRFMDKLYNKFNRLFNRNK